MAGVLKTQASRMLIKRSEVSGNTPSIGPSPDHTDGSWVDTNIYPGEFYWNMASQRLWLGWTTTGGTGVTEISLTGGTGGGGVSSVSVSNGLSGDTTTGNINLVNIDKGSSQNIFKNVKIDGTTQFSASNNNDDLNFSGTNITITSGSPNTLVFSGVPQIQLSGTGNVSVTGTYPNINVGLVFPFGSSYVVYKDVNTYTSVGTGSQTLASVMIPGGTFTSGDTIQVRARFRRDTSGASTQVHIHNNTANNLTGANVWKSTIFGTTTRWGQFYGHGIVKDTTTNTELFATNTNVNIDDALNTSNGRNVAIDWSVNQYFLFSVFSITTPDVFLLTYFEITKR